jgi:hypothetical protein
MRIYACLALAAALAAFGSDAQARNYARSWVEAGHLECRGQATSYILASVTRLDCVFRPHHGRPEPYSAEIRRFGVDIGWNKSTVLVWAVFAPTKRVGPGSLNGIYVGGSANATVGIGVGANALFGGSDSTISLQPVSVQGQIGIGAAGGISALALQAEAPRRIRRSRR